MNDIRINKISDKGGCPVFERKFSMIEGENFKLHELGKEIESIVGSKLEDVIGHTTRILGYKPNLSNEIEYFNIKFQLLHVPDYVDVVVTTDKKPSITDYHFEDETFKVEIISYRRMSQPRKS